MENPVEETLRHEMLMNHDWVEVWNIHDGIPNYSGAQQVLNILGRLDDPEAVGDFFYRLNGGPEVRIFFRSALASAPRLARNGDFNIDTISRDRLLAENRLQLIANRKDGRRVERSFNVTGKSLPGGSGRFELDLEHARYPQQVGQPVDGKWRIRKDGAGEASLEIRHEDAGLDRIILFGKDDLRPDFTIRARLQVNQWLSNVHNVGLLFLWNPHLRGDGTCLPSQWTTGLGYFYSFGPGLRIRIGIDVHLDEKGEKVGDNVLGEGMISPHRYWANRIVRRTTGAWWLFPQILPGVQYWFELKVCSDEHALTVWPAGRLRPSSPQVVANNPPLLLTRGSVGIIAHYCAVRVFEFHLEPHGESKSVG